MIELKDLQKIVDPGRVINVPWLEVKAGEIAALVGTVDSGKDELIQLLIGSIRPSSGHVRLAGLDPYHEHAAFSRQVGVLFSEDNLYQRLSVLGNLQFYCRLSRLPKTRAVEVLEQVGLADHANVSAEKITPGLTRRLELGRAFLNHPKVLLLADPFAGCEQASVKLISQVVRTLADAGAAVLII